MKQVILIAQIVVSILLMAVILIQPRSSGLGKTFGAASVSFARRGLEKLIYKLTFVLALLFTVVSLFSLMV